MVSILYDLFFYLYVKIIDIINQKKLSRPTLSFEIFPPKSASSLNIVDVANDLARFEPDFISVTYGAGGSTHDKTIEIASLIKKKYGIETIAHLTCISFTRTQIESTANELVNNNIENVLALRGDLPTDPNFKFPTPLHFAHASDLVDYLSQNYEFCLGGAFYPEGHTESVDLASDLFYTQNKIKSGMKFLISQAFFDNRFFYRARSELRASHFKTPLLAGIMPILSMKQIEHIIQLSGCSIPTELAELLNKHRGDPDALFEAGIEYTACQIEDLIENHVDGIHIYTMNNPKAVNALLKRICYHQEHKEGNRPDSSNKVKINPILRKIC
jgi:methylenetetrahydrofolate reductase (NADPH)